MAERTKVSKLEGIVAIVNDEYDSSYTLMEYTHTTGMPMNLQEMTGRVFECLSDLSWLMEEGYYDTTSIMEFDQFLDIFRTQVAREKQARERLALIADYIPEELFYGF